jgi:DNA primase
LEQRGFNPDELVNEWSLSSTDGRETDKNWRWRIVVPIYMAHRLVSYVGRTIGHRMDKYRAAPKEWRSLNPHDTLYGLDKVCGNTVVVMEGPADVWRWGPGAVALFGDQSSLSQRILLRRFRRAIIMLDGDDAGKTAGEKLAWQMSGFGMEVQQAILPDGLDPGQLDSGQVQELKKDLGLI